MMDFLRQLNFKPATGADALQFQTALLQGDPRAIHPMLAWMLVRMPELKKRACARRGRALRAVPTRRSADARVRVG